MLTCSIPDHAVYKRLPLCYAATTQNQEHDVQMPALSRWFLPYTLQLSLSMHLSNLTTAAEYHTGMTIKVCPAMLGSKRAKHRMNAVHQATKAGF